MLWAVNHCIKQSNGLEKGFVMSDIVTVPIAEEPPLEQSAITIIEARNPVWSNADHTALDVEAKFSHFPIWADFTAVNGSGEPHTQVVWDQALSGEFGTIAEYVEREPEPVVIVIPAVTLWERMTEDEAEQVAEVMATQPFRTRKIFETAATFRSDHELWPLLEQIATQLFGATRAAELLAS